MPHDMKLVVDRNKHFKKIFLFFLKSKVSSAQLLRELCHAYHKLLKQSMSTLLSIYLVYVLYHENGELFKTKCPTDNWHQYLIVYHRLLSST